MSEQEYRLTSNWAFGNGYRALMCGDVMLAKFDTDSARCALISECPVCSTKGYRKARTMYASEKRKFRAKVDKIISDILDKEDARAKEIHMDIMAWTAAGEQAKAIAAVGRNQEQRFGPGDVEVNLNRVPLGLG